MENSYMSIKEIAAFFSVSVNEVYRWVNAGCPSQRIPFKGGRVRYRMKLKDVLQYTEDNKISW